MFTLHDNQEGQLWTGFIQGEQEHLLAMLVGHESMEIWFDILAVTDDNIILGIQLFFPVRKIDNGGMFPFLRISFDLLCAPFVSDRKCHVLMNFCYMYPIMLAVFTNSLQCPEYMMG